MIILVLLIMAFIGLVLHGRLARGQYLSVLLIGLLATPFGAVADEAAKRELQWAYIGNFLSFITWPGPQDAVLKVCIIGRDPFVYAQQKSSITNKGKDRAKRERKIVRYEKMPEFLYMEQCYVIYFADNITTAQLSFIFSQLKDRPIITIGEHQGFINIGGLLQFIERDKKLRFRLNKAKLSTMDIKIHPSLLRLSE